MSGSANGRGWPDQPSTSARNGRTRDGDPSRDARRGLPDTDPRRPRQSAGVPAYGPGHGSGHESSQGDTDTPDTGHIPAAALPTILASERAESREVPPTSFSGSVSRSIADLDTRDSPAISMARRRGYDEKARALADAETLHALAASVGEPSRPATPPPFTTSPDLRWASIGRAMGQMGQSKSLRYAALVLALALLALRAGIASAAFMSPGGTILGWTSVPTPVSPFVSVTPPTTQQQHPLTPSEYASLLVGKLTLDQELGQLMLLELSASQPTPMDDQMVATQDVGGILFFGYNITSANEIRASTAHLKSEAPIPLLMTVDQEGGPVNRFSTIVGQLPSAASLTSTDQAHARGVQDAGILHEYGFNLNLAPDVDVGTSNPQLAGRTFGNDPARVAVMGGAYLEGLQADGTVTGTLKHFAGLGGTATDPHTGLPNLNASRADWESTYVSPFRTLLAQHDVRAVMVTHVMIPQVDPELPTSLSPTVIDGVLRGELGFQGVVITDDVFKMEAINERYPGPQAAVMAVEAGADVVIGPTSQTVQQTKSAFEQAINSGQLTKARIDLSVQRILTLKIEMGLIPMPASATPSPTASPTPDKNHANTASPVAAYRSSNG